MINYCFVGSPFENYWGMKKNLGLEIETQGLIHFTSGLLYGSGHGELEKGWRMR